MLTWKDTSVGMQTPLIRHEADTLISYLSIIMQTDSNGKRLGFTVCAEGRIIRTDIMNVSTAKLRAVSIFRELLRDQLGMLG